MAINLVPSSLSDLKEIGCKSAWSVHISPLFWSIERLLTCKIVKICPSPAEFSLRFFKSDRLLEKILLALMAYRQYGHHLIIFNFK